MLVLDLMRDPRIARNPIVRHAVSALLGFVTLHGVETDEGHVDVSFRALPIGFRGAAKALRRHVVRPSIGRLLPS